MAYDVSRIRKPDDDLSRVRSAYDANVNMFSLKIHHGGVFVGFPERRYVNGQEAYIDLIDIDTFSVLELSSFMKELGYTHGRPMFYHFRVPNNDLDYGLKALACDEDVITLSKHVDNDFDPFLGLDDIIGNQNLGKVMDDCVTRKTDKGKEKMVDDCVTTKANKGNKRVVDDGENSNDSDDSQDGCSSHSAINNEAKDVDKYVEVIDNDLFDSSESDEDQVEVNPEIPVKAIQDQLQKKYRLDVSKMKAFRAKSKAYAHVRGNYREQYKVLRNYCLELSHKNPGSFKRRVFLELEWGSIGLGLDGASHERFFSGQVLAAIGLDSNNGIYPVAYAIVEAKNKDSWTWFLECLGEDLNLGPMLNFTFITYRQKDGQGEEGQGKAGIPSSKCCTWEHPCSWVECTKGQATSYRLVYQVCYGRFYHTSGNLRQIWDPGISVAQDSKGSLEDAGFFAVVARQDFSLARRDISLVTKKLHISIKASIKEEVDHEEQFDFLGVQLNQQIPNRTVKARKAKARLFWRKFTVTIDRTRRPKSIQSVVMLRLGHHHPSVAGVKIRFLGLNVQRLG
ncbi:hypothetical protein Tco_0154836 [Tanacetum coccineum]